MNDPIDWDGYVSHTYAQVVAESDSDTGIARQDAFHVAQERITTGIESGEIEVDLASVIRQALTRADETHGKRGDRIIEATVKGELTLFGSADELNTVITLGNGRRKIWRHINEFDLESMDVIRYRNLEAAQDAYRHWRIVFQAARPAIREFGTVENAIAAGAFEPGNSAGVA